MELNQMVVSPAEAAAKVHEYAAVLAADRSAEDQALLSAYRAAKRGLPLISLPRTIAAGGFHDNSLPRLAVVRADATECYAWWERDAVIYTDNDRTGNRSALVGQRSVRVPLAGDELPSQRRTNWRRGRTMVPLVPPGLRPRWPRLRAFHILWEVDEWERVAPYDPALIRHLRGDLWTVHGTWLLTDLERSVLSQRVTVR
jgi:hypothetical protein